MTATFAFAVGIRNTNGAGLVLDCLYPNPIMQPSADIEAAIADFAEGVTLLTEQSAATLHAANGITKSARAPLPQLDAHVQSNRLHENGPDRQQRL